MLGGSWKQCLRGGLYSQTPYLSTYDCKFNLVRVNSKPSNFCKKKWKETEIFEKSGSLKYAFLSLLFLSRMDTSKIKEKTQIYQRLSKYLWAYFCGMKRFKFGIFHALLYRTVIYTCIVQAWIKLTNCLALSSLIIESCSKPKTELNLLNVDYEKEKQDQYFFHGKLESIFAPQQTPAWGVWGKGTLETGNTTVSGRFPLPLLLQRKPLSAEEAR